MIWVLRVFFLLIVVLKHITTAAVAQSVKASGRLDVRIPVATDRSDKKQVVTAPLLNALQQLRVSRVLGDGHYKRMSCVAVGVAR